MTSVIASSSYTSSDSVQLFVLIFCFNNKDEKFPCPNIKYALVWRFQYECTTNDASMFQIRVQLLYAPTVRIQTAKLWISYEHPARNKRAGNRLHFIHNNTHSDLNI